MYFCQDSNIDNISRLVDKINIKYTIINNEPIEDKLNVIIVISNPCNYKKRYILAKRFINRMNLETNVNLYIVELINPGQEYQITQKNNPNHLQLESKYILWMKECMINQGVKLLPSDWKAFAFIDADIIFDNPHWVNDTLKLLNSFDIVQLFSHAIDMDENEDTMNIFTSFGYKYIHRRKHFSSGKINQISHPGYGYAITRKAYEQIGGLYELSIIGSGDQNMAMSLINKGQYSLNNQVHPDYLNSVIEFQNKAYGLKLGYTPGIIKHEFHGSKQNRKYSTRWHSLVKYQYSPIKHIQKDINGLIEPTKDCPQGLLDDIIQYFKDRNEDE